MRISDWSSDVCSSDLRQFLAAQYVGGTLNNGQQIIEIMRDTARQLAERLHLLGLPKLFLRAATFGNFRFQLPIGVDQRRSEEHTSELQSLMRISYAVFCLKNKTLTNCYDLNQTLHN